MKHIIHSNPDIHHTTSFDSVVTVQALLKTIRLLCITASVGRSRSVKNAADTKLRRSKNQVGLNCNIQFDMYGQNSPAQS